MLYIEKATPGIVKGMRIAIVMLSSPDIPNYAHFAAINNYLYSKKHSYDFIVERQPRDTVSEWSWNPTTQSSVSWYKAELLKRHLKNYDYVLFVDSDAFFNNFSYTIENELVPLVHNEKCIIFQEDVWRSDNIGTNRGLVCTGLIFLKHCEESFAILDAWARAPYIDNNCEKMRYTHPREQECIMYLMNKDQDIKRHILVYDASKAMFGQYDSDWIIHMGGTTTYNRTEMISRYCHAKFQEFIIETAEQIK